MARVARKPIIIEFWDVGQGDASVIRPNRSRVFIIDVGPRNSPIVDWLAKNPSVFVDGIVLTHNDADHAGALMALIQAARSRIDTVYFLVDRKPKDLRFIRLFARLNAAVKAGEVKRILRLEAPQTVWRDDSGSVEVRVMYPNVSQNISASNPNATSGVLALCVGGQIRIIWASDAPIEIVERVCPNSKPEFMVGPHHGAPSDRAHQSAEKWLASICARTTVISVGSKNKHAHPQPSYIRNSLKCGSRIMCTQLTPLCDRDRRTDVVKSHARLGLPQPNTGIACRGPIRVMLLGSGDIVGDELDGEHRQEIERLQRPKCLLLLTKQQ